MKLLETLQLNYVTSDGELHTPPVGHMSEEWYLEWLHEMVEFDTDTIFFYTVGTTDVFEKDWDVVGVIESPEVLCGHHNEFPCNDCISEYIFRDQFNER